MDSDVQLAIIEKARQVFGGRNTFLSFPVTVPSFSAGALDLEDESDDPRQDVQQLAEFSRLVNQIPTGMSWSSSEELYLWDVYNDILRRSRIASVVRSDEDEATYRRALDYLYDETEEGARVPSAEAARYQESYDASVVLRERFRSAKIDAEMSEDSRTREHWAAVEEPAWRQEFHSLEAEWRANGFKEEVEQARLIEETMAGRAPSTTWHEWQSMFDPDIDMRRDFGEQRFAESRFSPVNALRDGSWLRFTLTREVARSLVENAPPELRKKLGGSASTIERLDTLSFEYSTAKIDRYWFKPALFRARFFDYPEVVSDGQDPEIGVCPAYVAAVVFARKVAMKLKSGPGEPPVTVPPLKVLARLSFKMAQPKALMVPGVATRLRTISKAEGRPNSPQPTISPQMPLRKRPIAARHKVVRPNLTLAPQRLSGPGVGVGPTPSTPVVPDATEASGKDEVFILAMICKQLPPCPNPNPDLDWEF